MRSILATSGASPRFSGLTPATFVSAGSLLVAALWGTWASHQIAALQRREVVTVQLSRIMSEFVETEARSGRPAAQTQARVGAYLKAVEASVEQLGKEGHTVLVAEAVVASSVPDLTDQVRADVARRLGATTGAPSRAAQ